MKKIRSFFLWLLAAALLSGCAAGPAIPSAAEITPLAEVAYVPLDDRPVNTDRVAYLAESLGYEWKMPDEALYHTCLDGQALNPDGTRYGDRGALLDWVRQMDAEGCDLFILSVDQLLSGGLVSSRSMQGVNPISCSDGTSLTEEQAVDDFLLTLAKDPNNRIYLLDTVMRLAPTVGYDGFDLDSYEALRSYGMEARPTLAGSALTVDSIVADYPLGADGTTAAADPSLSSVAISHYLAARERKLRLSAGLMEKTAGLDNVHYLIGVDDSAPTASIQTNELAYLRQALGTKGALLSGTDELGMMAVCRLYEDTAYDRTLPSVWVRYFGGSESKASSDYDHQPMTEIVDAHLAYLGVTAEEGSGADLQVLVLTAPADPAKAADSCSALIRTLNENEAAGIPTILIDAAKNQYGTAFQKKLVSGANLGFLLGYAGFYDLANVTGIALSNGLARYLCLTEGAPRSAEQDADFLRTLSDSLLKDICYKNSSKIKITAYVRDTLSGNPDNFAQTGTDPHVVLSKLSQYLAKDTKPVLENLESSAYLVSLSPRRTAGVGRLSLSDFLFPLQRVFEILISISVGSPDAPLFYNSATDAHFDAALLPR